MWAEGRPISATCMEKKYVSPSRQVDPSSEGAATGASSMRLHASLTFSTNSFVIGAFLVTGAGIVPATDGSSSRAS